MTKGNSVAPTERVNIRYKSHVGEAQEEVELPLKILVLGDLTGSEDDRVVEERKPVRVTPDNFNEVLGAANVRVNLDVTDQLRAGAAGEKLPVSLHIKKLSDLTPDGIVAQVPELRELLALRNALSSLRGPLGNRPNFRKRLQQALSQPQLRDELRRALAEGESGGQTDASDE